MGKILLINDHEKIKEIITSVLKAVGHEVEDLNDSLEVFDRVLQINPDLIIIDINLNFVDGLFLVERLLSSEESPEIPVLVISSKNELLMLLDSIERGASDYLSFPINEDTLISKVDSIISKTNNA